MNAVKIKKTTPMVFTIHLLEIPCIKPLPPLSFEESLAKNFVSRTPLWGGGPWCGSMIFLPALLACCGLFSKGLKNFTSRFGLLDGSWARVRVFLPSRRNQTPALAAGKRAACPVRPRTRSCRRQEGGLPGVQPPRPCRRQEGGLPGVQPPALAAGKKAACLGCNPPPLPQARRRPVQPGHGPAG